MKNLTSYISSLFLIILAIISCKELEIEREMLVITGISSEVTATTATLSGTIEDLGEGVTQYGHCWSTNPNPTVEETSSLLGKAEKVGTYSSILENLLPNTTYFIRAYVQSRNLVVYGDEFNFNTLSPELASLKTGIVKDITINSVKVISELNALGDGCDTIYQYGHCWHIKGEPTIHDSLTSLGRITDTTSYFSNLANLKSGTAYYIRAYAINKAGVAYGEELQFNTINEKVPQVETLDTILVSETKIILKGQITDLGTQGDSVISYGHCWSTEPRPTIEDDIVSLGSANSLKTYESKLENLTPGTKYHIRSYALNNKGVNYGEEKTIITKHFLPILSAKVVEGSVDHNSAIIEFSMIEKGTAKITAMGICWSKVPNPDISDSVVYLDNNPEFAELEINSLYSNSEYYFRAFAITVEKSIYSKELVLETSETVLPEVRGFHPKLVEGYTIEMEAELIDNGGEDPISFGICYADNPYPSSKDNVVDLSSNYISQTKINLPDRGTYCFKVFAKNSKGTSYSDPRYYKIMSYGVDVRFVPGGKFLMGSDSGNPDEQPIHEVEIEPFFISTYEITNKEYCRFLNESDVKTDIPEGSAPTIELDKSDILNYYGQYVPKPGMDNYPVTGVAFAGFLNFCEAGSFSYIKEAQWEWAAKGAMNSNDPINLDSMAWHSNNSDNQIHEVGQRKPNQLGIYDLFGNVKEIVLDSYNEDFYSVSPVYEPVYVYTQSQWPNVVRGGSYNSPQNFCNATNRDSLSLRYNGYENCGFRVILGLKYFF